MPSTIKEGDTVPDWKILGAVSTIVLGISGCVTFMGPPIYSHGAMANFTTTPNGRPDRYSHENPTPASVASIDAGNEVFQEHCAECHGSGARGDGPAGAELDGPQAPDLVKTAARRTEGELYGFIAYGRPDMPDWRRVLEEKDLWNVVNFLRSLAEKAKEKN